MTWKSYAVVSGAGLLATYLASPTLAPDRTVPQPSPAAQSTTAASLDIEYEAARLQKRVRDETAFHTPSRNPFRFGAITPVPRREPVAASAVPLAAAVGPSAPEPPFVALSGIAADVVDGVLQRTAILTTMDGVVLARAGDTVGPYRVRAIADEAVELESILDGSIRQLRFAAPAPPIAAPVVP